MTKTEVGISCYWCNECFTHLACLIYGRDEETDKEMDEILRNRKEEHDKICSGRIDQ